MLTGHSLSTSFGAEDLLILVLLSKCRSWTMPHQCLGQLLKHQILRIQMALVEVYSENCVASKRSWLVSTAELSICGNNVIVCVKCHLWDVMVTQQPG